MCGIAGYYGLDDEALVKEMNAVQSHRGPDGEGLFLRPGIALAHRRLSIIDRAHGAQPMADETGKHFLIYNGEVYNYLELREALQKEGFVFRTESDTEVVLAALIHWGLEGLDRLNGMFGLAYYEVEKKRLTLARDHFGIKPLYYHLEEADGKPFLLFSSELKSILAADFVDRSPDERVIYRYLRFRIHDEGETTFFSSIKRLLPGAYLQISPEGVKKGMYTRLREDLALQSQKRGRVFDQAAVEAFRQSFERSVSIRLQSEVPVGTSLSGGLDSSSVVALIARFLEEDRAMASVGTEQKTFSAIFPKSINDEEAYIDDLLRLYGERIEPHKIQPKPGDLLEDLDDFIRTMEEPIISTGPYAQYAVMREASKHVTVLLDGQGADEMMAGYDPYYLVYLRQLKKQRRWGRLLVEIWGAKDILYKLLRRKIFTRKRAGSGDVGELLSPSFAQKYREERYEKKVANLKLRLLDDIFVHSLPSLLRYEDRNTMRFSLEGRIPFLDKELLKLLFELDESAILKMGWNKNILRRSMAEDLPKSIAWRRRKIGFTTPEEEWFSRLSEALQGIFESESFQKRPYFDGKKVLAAFACRMEDKGALLTMDFWRFLNLELWLRNYVDGREYGKGQKPKLSAVG